MFLLKIKELVKSKKIQIQASGGLSDDEINKMVKEEAEANKEADKKKRRCQLTQEIKLIHFYIQQKKI